MDVAITRNCLESIKASSARTERHTLSYPIVMEQRPFRKRRLLIMWPHARGCASNPPVSLSMTAITFSAVLTGLPEAASAPIKPPKGLLSPEVTWVAHVRRSGASVGDNEIDREHCLLVNWSSVWMEDTTSSLTHRAKVQCRISGHVVTAGGGDLLTRFTISFPIQRYGTLMSKIHETDGCWVTRLSALSLQDEVGQQPRLLVVVGTCDGGVHAALTQAMPETTSATPVNLTIDSTSLVTYRAECVREVEVYYHDAQSLQGEALTVVVRWPSLVEFRRAYLSTPFVELEDLESFEWHLIAAFDLSTQGQPAATQVVWDPCYDQVALYPGTMLYFLQLPDLRETSKNLPPADFLAAPTFVRDQQVIGGCPVVAAVPTPAEEESEGSESEESDQPSVLSLHYRINGRPTFIHPIPSLNLWVVAVRKCLRVVSIEGSDLRVKSVLIGHRDDIYRGESDGGYRYCSIDNSELLIVWDLRRRVKLMQLDLVDPFFEFGNLQQSVLEGVFHSSSTDSLLKESASELPFSVADTPVPDTPVAVTPVADTSVAETPVADTSFADTSPVQVETASERSSSRGSEDVLTQEEFPVLGAPQENLRSPRGAWGQLNDSVKEAPHPYLRENSTGDLVPSELGHQFGLEAEMQRIARECGLSTAEFEAYQHQLIEDEALNQVLESTRTATEFSPELITELAAADGLSPQDWLDRQHVSLPEESPAVAEPADVSQVELIDAVTHTKSTPRPMVSVLARKLFGLPCPDSLQADDLGQDPLAGDDRLTREAKKYLEKKSGGFTKRRFKKTVRDLDIQSVTAVAKYMAGLEDSATVKVGPSGLTRYRAKFGNRRAVSNIVFTPSQLSVYIPCLGVWQTWDM
eukprot:Blabericola_migrator_1__1157@NODE_129_length_13297_cov_112_007559_g114_i0_p1_GENE_NODE_129_length_13297_cov_112_007559_g114_i0NODE_129_length_13297_cov_112_007559_g114_i0_p1_ORF_typecomplete_len863_score131_63_NODE_129_length_13297_cov_112_007559_g114_i05683156